MNATDVTTLLKRAQGGEASARESLWRCVYDHMRELARRQLQRERSGHTLQPTELVHEAFLKLDQADRAHWESRRHFYGAAARAMREILVDHARGHRPLGEDIEIVWEPSEECLADVATLDRALRMLESIPAYERHARVIDLRYFAQLTIDETAAALGVSPATVKRDWEFARAWILRRMESEEAT